MDKMSKKIYRISGRCVRTNEIKAEDRKKIRLSNKTAMKGIFGIVLIVLAAVFGGAISALNDAAAFGVVFTYICTQLAIWLV